MNKYLLVIDQICVGGSERILLDYYAYLRKEGYEVIIFSLHGYQGRSAWTEGIDVIYGSDNNNGNLLRKLFRQIRLYLQLRKLIKKSKPDVVFSFLEKSNLLVTLTTLNKKIVRVVTVHNVLSIQYQKIKSKLICTILYSIIKWMYCNNSHVIAVSEQVKEDLVTTFQIHENNIFVVNNYVNGTEIIKKSNEDIDNFDFSPEVKYILNIGRFSLQKAQHKLIEAFDLLVNKDDLERVHILFIGAGEREHELKQLVEKKKLQAYITFLPFDLNPYKYMKKAHLFVLSSIYEGFPIVISEISSLRIPFVGSNKAIPREMFSDHVIWQTCTFPVSDADDADIDLLAALLKRGIFDEKLRIEILESTNNWEIENSKAEQFRKYQELTKQGYAENNSKNNIHE